MHFVSVKYSELITLEGNKISIRELPLWLPLFVGFSLEVLNSGIKTCFDRVFSQDAVYKECLSAFSFSGFLLFIFTFLFLFYWPYLKLWVDYHRVQAILCLILFLMPACSHLSLRILVTMTYCTLTKVLLDFVAPRI